MSTSIITFANASDALCLTTANTWTDPDKSLVSSNDGAICDFIGPGMSSCALAAYGNAGETVPADAIIDSITLAIKARATQGIPFDNAAYIATDITSCGEWIDLGANPGPAWDSDWTTKEWDVDPSGWIGSDFGGANFGVAYAFHHGSLFAFDGLEIDEFKVTVQWHRPASGRGRARQPGRCCKCGPDCTIHSETFNTADSSDLGTFFDELDGDWEIEGDTLKAPVSGELQCNVENPAGDAITRASINVLSLEDGASIGVYIDNGLMEARLTRSADDYTLGLWVDGAEVDSLAGMAPGTLKICTDGEQVVAQVDSLDQVIKPASADLTGTKAGLLTSGGSEPDSTFLDHFIYSSTSGDCPSCRMTCWACDDTYISLRWMIEISGVVGANLGCSDVETVLNGSFVVYFDPIASTDIDNPGRCYWEAVIGEIHCTNEPFAGGPVVVPIRLRLGLLGALISPPGGSVGLSIIEDPPDGDLAVNNFTADFDQVGLLCAEIVRTLLANTSPTPPVFRHVDYTNAIIYATPL